MSIYVRSTVVPLYVKCNNQPSSKVTYLYLPNASQCILMWYTQSNIPNFTRHGFCIGQLPAKIGECLLGLPSATLVARILATKQAGAPQLAKFIFVTPITRVHCLVTHMYPTSQWSL